MYQAFQRLVLERLSGMNKATLFCGVLFLSIDDFATSSSFDFGVKLRAMSADKFPPNVIHPHVDHTPMLTSPSTRDAFIPFNSRWHHNHNKKPYFTKVELI
jgi:hypothetical protein